MNGKNYLLAIAIDDYKHFNKLNNAVKDIEEITNILTSLYQFDKDNVYTLYNDQATEDGIDDKFLELIDTIQPEDNLVVFYSGHGYYRENVREGYWIPIDGRKDKVSDYISNANLIHYLHNIDAHHVLMVVDSCFSGALVEQIRGDTASERFPSRRVIASGRTETKDGVPGENSPFAKGVIDFLKANLEQEISTTAMVDSVRNYVGRVSDQDPVEGRLRNSKDNRGEFFFKRKLSEEEFWTNTLANGKTEAFKEYLEIYPDGTYALEAKNYMRKEKERLAWLRAENSNTPDDYNSFIFSYPESEYVSQARAKLELLKKADAERRRVLQEKAKEEKEIQEYRAKYRRLARGAENAIQSGDYRTAREHLWECESYYMEGKEGFIPDINEIRAKRKHCTKQIDFQQYLEDGNVAFKTRDYASAIKLFNQALLLFPGEEKIIRLRNAANTLMNTDQSVVVTKGVKNSPASIKKNKPIVVNPGTGKRNKASVVINPSGKPGSKKQRPVVVKPKPQPSTGHAPGGSNIPIKPPPVPSPPVKNNNKKDYTYPIIAVLLVLWAIIMYYIFKFL